jgi:predicted dehydrogenase
VITISVKNTQDKYRCAVVGLGRIGSQFEHTRPFPSTHSGVYRHLENTELWAGCDIDRDKLTDFSKLWNVPLLFDDYRDLIDDEDIDILSICTHPDTHKEICKYAAKHGPDIKAIFCEKPIAENIEDAKEMLQVCYDNNVKLAVNHTHRWDDTFNIAKDIIGKDIGELVTVNAYCYPGIKNMGTHLIDIVTHLCGDITGVMSLVAPQETNLGDDYSGVAIVVIKDTLGTINVLPNRNYMMFEVDVHGTEGRVVISNNSNKLEAYRVGDSKLYPEYNELVAYRRVEKFILPHSKCFINAVNDIIECIGTDKECKSNGYTATRTLEVVEKILNI